MSPLSKSSTFGSKSILGSSESLRKEKKKKKKKERASDEQTFQWLLCKPSPLVKSLSFITGA